MSDRRRRATVVLLSAEDTLVDLGSAVRSAGLGFRRVEAIRAHPCRPRLLSGPRVRSAPVDTLVITSRHAVRPGLLGWARRRGGGRTPEAWAAGPGSAERLRRAGFRRIRRSVGLGAEELARRMGRGTRTIVYFRSDLAGGDTARRLRALGHRVFEFVNYRVVPRPSALRRAAPAILGAGAVVLASPSAAQALRRVLASRDRRTLGGSVPAVVLGTRTARAARSAGFRTVRVAPSADPQRFARFLVRVVSHGTSGPPGRRTARGRG